MNDKYKSTVYQIYIKSFKDSDNDGIGDLKGINEKLDYIKWLGIDYIWITPFFSSPLNDNGYDVSDYYGINPVFGTIEDFEELVAKANKHNIKIMLDMVFNHTSTEHEWFQKALSGNEKYMNYYIFKAPVNDREPTNWTSKFGGSAWKYVEELDKYYLHLFDVTQADLNWDNPDVRNELKKVLNFWKQKGVCGFRFDVINLISKPQHFKDDELGDGRRFYTDGHRVHEYIKELANGSDIKDMLTVGEMSSTSIDNCIRYSNMSNCELSMTFSFHHLKVDYKNGNKWELQEPDYKELKKIMFTWQNEMYLGGGWNALFWCNHDQPRAVSRFCMDKKYEVRCAKMLALFLHFLRGTPYVFMGEELGMTNANFMDIDQYRDVESLNYFDIMINSGKSREEALKILEQRSRDNGRTPMLWDSSENAGFTKGNPWIKINNGYKNKNATVQSMEEDSVLNFYKELISLRKELDVVAYGDFEEIKNDNERIFSYKRKYKNQELAVFVNFSEKTQEFDVFYDLSEYHILISNVACKEKKSLTRLLPYEGISYLKN